MDSDFKQGLRRGLADRCPELKNEHRLAALLSKEGCSVDRSVLVFVQELLLKPHLTSADSVHGFDRSAFDLKTHEYVCMALSRILQLAPFLLSPILQYFAYAPPPFERLYHGKNVENGPSLLEAIRAAYRFLQMEPRNIRELWDWSPILNLLQLTESGLGLRGIVSDVRWCAVQVFWLVFGMSDAASRNLSCLISNLSEEDAFECLIRWEEFSQEIAIEKVGMFAGCEHWPVAVEGSTDMDYKSVVKWKQQQNGKVSHVSVCSVELPIRGDFSASQRRTQSSFVVTPVFIRKYPVLLQGPTSGGKTSLVRYLAAVTGHKFVRINNHEHTHLLGSYVSDHAGKLVFQVEAVMKGYWVVFDELTLAPSDVLEALTRLLDDNRELFVPELQVTVKPHPQFMLFATQNPPGVYGGRKDLSRAFRNGFVELHVDDIPSNELVTILEKREGFRPVRGRENIALNFQELVAPRGFSNALSSATTLESVTLVLKLKGACTGIGVTATVELTLKKMQILHKEWQSLFVWHNGPLVIAMKNGDLFLIDEINLADDSVLERLNSARGAEKGGNEVDEIVARFKFRIMATMNPGGDFGKKELSHALGNRFTKVWVPSISDLDDLRSIISERLNGAFECLIEPLIQFWKWIQQRQETARLLSVRDLLSWINYINTCASEIGIYAAFEHGCFLVLLDGLGLGSGLSSVSTKDIRAKCVDFLLKLVPENYKGKAEEACGLHSVSSVETDNIPANTFEIHFFYISRGCSTTENALTTSRNVLRAMQLPKPVLLEGSPGVGKTSLVSALAAASGHTLVHIDLSEQMDTLDLFGSDLPVEGGKAGKFQWSDPIFFQALKAGNWVLLDELNLASQSVLEGLNSCFDHPSEVFIPELGLVFKCPPTFRLFACQNPLDEGGGRKGLPKSFLNRFQRVHAEPLSSDYLFIARALHPRPEDILLKMIEFSRLHKEIRVKHSYGHSGAPWKFNLHDILRWCILMEETHTSFRSNSDLFVNIVYIQRLRTLEDRAAASDLFKRIFGSLPSRCYYPDVSLSANNLRIGLAKLKRPKNSVALEEYSKHLDLLPGSGYVLEFFMHCIKNRWMCMLFGPLKSGKTRAHTTWNTLYEYHLLGSTDTTELLGCSEQHDTTRYLREEYTAAECSMQCLCLSQTVLSAERRVSTVKNVLASWSTLKKSRNIPVDQGVIVGLLNQLLEQLEAGTKLDFGLGVLLQLVISLSVERKENAGPFEWIDGDLLQAVKRGDWILLENANLCNPTVLDRLNSLLEPGGSLKVNECRLFFTLNPANGEVSRAMRNRGIGIFVSTPAEEEIVLSDASSLIKSFGVPGLPLIEEMAKVHVKVRSCNPWSISLREVLLERGGSFHWSMHYSWEQSYLACINTEQHSSAVNIFSRSARTVPRTELLKWLHDIKNLTAEIYSEKSIEIPEINTDTVEIDKKLLYAIVWALEQAPIFEIDRRVQWIRKFSMENMQKKVPALALEKEHPVSGALTDAWDHFKQVTNLSGTDSVSENGVLAECLQFVTGNMQLLVDQQRSQALQAHAAVFPTIEAPANDTHSVSKLELVPQPDKGAFLKKQPDLFAPPDIADPVSMQALQNQRGLFAQDGRQHGTTIIGFRLKHVGVIVAADSGFTHTHPVTKEEVLELDTKVPSKIFMIKEGWFVAGSGEWQNFTAFVNMCKEKAIAVESVADMSRQMVILLRDVVRIAKKNRRVNNTVSIESNDVVFYGLQKDKAFLRWISIENGVKGVQEEVCYGFGSGGWHAGPYLRNRIVEARPNNTQEAFNLGVQAMQYGITHDPDHSGGLICVHVLGANAADMEVLKKHDVQGVVLVNNLDLHV